MPALEIRDDRVKDLPPSAKLVYLVVAENWPCTQGEIADASLLPQRTVRSALERLEDEGVVESAPYVGDARKSVYRVSMDDAG